MHHGINNKLYHELCQTNMENKSFIGSQPVALVETARPNGRDQPVTGRDQKKRPSLDYKGGARDQPVTTRDQKLHVRATCAFDDFVSPEVI